MTILKRVNCIKNIGKFCDTSPGSISFKDTTIIFANNANGKTTFTSIIRSLATGNINLITGKKSFGSTGEQRIELVLGDQKTNTNIKFENQAWSKLHSNIWIFDSKFISENIFDGDEIVDNHKANLHRIIIGERGVTLAEKIQEVEKKITKNEQEKQQIITNYSIAGFKEIFSITDFLKLKPVLDIELKIKNKESEIRFNEQLEKPKEIKFDIPNFQDLETLLRKNFKSNHDIAELRIREHIRKCWNGSSKNIQFLEKGSSLLPKNDEQSCPFCGQKLKPVYELIKAYQIYFNKEYEKYQNNLNDLNNKFRRWNVENILSNLLLEAKSWNDYLIANEFVKLKTVIENWKDKIITSKTDFEREFEKKQKDINYVIDFAIFELIKTGWNEIHIAVEIYNKAIDSFVTQSNKKDIIILSKELLRLKIIKSRFEDNWINWYSKYESLQNINKILKAQRTTVINQLADYSKEVFEKNQKRINLILSNIGADFEIKNFNGHKDLRKSLAVFCGFELEFFNRHTIPIDGVDHKPNFKNTLSQGDKNALAFAFFLSLLYQDKNLKNKIVIFDDPVSSYDEERKLSTVHLLADLKNDTGEEPAQKIILTHEKAFLIKLYHEAKFFDAKYIKIAPDGVLNGTKKSKFNNCDVFVEFIKPDELSYLEELNDLIANNKEIPASVHSKLRNIFEAAFKSKYYLHLKEEIANKKGLGCFVDKLQNLKIYDTNKAAQLRRTFAKLQIPHHDNLEAKVSPNSDGDLKLIITNSLKALTEI